MTNVKNKTTAIAIAVIMVLAFNAIAAIVPSVFAKTSFTLDTAFYGYIGVNSPTEISWIPTPASSPLLLSDAYNGKTSVWPNATATLTRPDGSKDVINGPFKARPSLVQGRATRVDIVLIYTPNMMGNWSISFYWPGDTSYNAVNQTDTFTVGQHFEKRDVWAQLAMRPYPVVGLGQDLLINAWITPPPMNQRDYYEAYVFTFTKPDGTFFTVGPMDSELVGTVWFDLPLDTLGNWTVKFEFPGDHASKPASVTRTITVQNDWTPSYPDTPLPSVPWTFPINTENREWRNIAGPWYTTDYNASVGAWNPYTEAPRTAHILWKLDSSGQLGGYIGSPHSIQTGGGEVSYGAGDVGMYGSTVATIKTVMAGRGYYTAGSNIVCVDMRTGEKLWSVPGTFDVGTERGSTAALYSFGSRFIAYDAITGAAILNVTGLPGMSFRFYEAPYVYARTTEGNLIKWETTSTTTNFTARILWNITDTTLRGFETRFGAIQNGLYVYLDIFIDTYHGDVSMSLLTSTLVAVNTTTGEIVYNKPIQDSSDPVTWILRQAPATGTGYGLLYTCIIPHETQGRGWMAIDVATGTIKWISEATDYPWGNFWAYAPEACAYGMIYGLGYSGIYAFNVTNGDIVWHYIAKDIYNEEPYESNINATDGSTYASYSFGSTGPVIGGGIVFAPNTEHSPTFIYRNQQLHAVDAFTGDLVWSIKGVYTPSAIAYGILLASDSYNGFSYAFGKGETATTVSTSSKVIAKGENILLEGSVLDMSPAQAGTAAVSDVDQTAWMEYLHMQQPFPTNAKGVTVSLDAIDPNNNYVHIGNATSDTTGMYSFGWQPEIEGKYTVIASFYSTEAYYGSTAETAIYVGAAPAASTTAGEQTQVIPDNTMTIIAVGIAMIIAIAVATVLLLRKRP